MDAPNASLTRRAVLAALLAAPLAAAGRPASAAPAASRIVAAGGVVTEIVYALGRQDLLVGVDVTSLFPAEAMKQKPSVGYVRALSAEGILSLRPDLVIAIEGAGPPDALKLVTDAGVRVVHITDEPSAAGVSSRIRAVADLVDAAAAGAELAASVEAGFRDLAVARAAVTAPKRVLFVLALQNGRPMVGGRNSSADAMIRLAGGVNAGEAVEGYKPMSDEAVIAAAPDLVLMMNRGQHALQPAELFALPAFSATPAAAGASLVSMDGLYLLGFGPRTPAAARDLMTALYPGLERPAR